MFNRLGITSFKYQVIIADGCVVCKGNLMLDILETKIYFDLVIADGENMKKWLFTIAIIL